MAIEKGVKNDDPEGYSLLFGTYVSDETNIDNENIIETHQNETSTEIDEDYLYRQKDPVQRQKFNNNRPTFFVNDFPELDIRDSNDPVVVAPGEGKIPTNILKEDDWDIKSYPCLFPDGRNGLHEKRDVKISMQQYFQQRLLNVDRRFSCYTGFVFAAFACNELNVLERNINISFMRGKPVKTAGNTKYTLDDPCRVLDKSPGTPNFFKQKRNELIARIENLGPFEIFLHLVVERKCTMTILPHF